MVTSTPKKYQLPEFLVNIVDQETYEHWLRRQAASLVTRDRKSGAPVSAADYRVAIHDAVLASNGFDCD